MGIFGDFSVVSVPRKRSMKYPERFGENSEIRRNISGRKFEIRELSFCNCSDLSISYKIEGLCHVNPWRMQISHRILATEEAYSCRNIKYKSEIYLHRVAVTQL